MRLYGAEILLNADVDGKILNAAGTKKNTSA
jgi:hypothetical protein